MFLSLLTREAGRRSYIDHDRYSLATGHGCDDRAMHRLSLPIFMRLLFAIVLYNIK
jgi:hypothetical protein